MAENKPEKNQQVSAQKKLPPIYMIDNMPAQFTHPHETQVQFGGKCETSTKENFEKIKSHYNVTTNVTMKIVVDYFIKNHKI